MEPGGQMTGELPAGAELPSSSHRTDHTCHLTPDPVPSSVSPQLLRLPFQCPSGAVCC